MRLALDVPRISGPFHDPTVRLELQGAHRPRLVNDTTGHPWVLKNLQPRGILAEAIGALLGRQLGVPIPNFGYFDDDENGRGWMSSYVSFAQPWHGRRLQDVENLHALGRMLVLDAIIYNEDRNPENFIFEPSDEPECYSFWAIDMEQALVSRPREFASKGNKCPDPFALPPDFTANALDEPIERAVRLASALPDVTLTALVSAAVRAAGTRDENVLFEALRLRCRNAEQIVKDYLDRLAERPA